MTLYEFLKPLQKIKFENEEIDLSIDGVWVFKGKIAETPFKYLDGIITYWSYNAKDRLIVKITKNNK